MRGKGPEDLTQLARPGMFLWYTAIAVFDVANNVKV